MTRSPDYKNGFIDSCLSAGLTKSAAARLYKEAAVNRSNIQLGYDVAKGVGALSRLGWRGTAATLRLPSVINGEMAYLMKRYPYLARSVYAIQGIPGGALKLYQKGTQFSPWFGIAAAGIPAGAVVANNMKANKALLDVPTLTPVQAADFDKLDFDSEKFMDLGKAASVRPITSRRRARKIV